VGGGGWYFVGQRFEGQPFDRQPLGHDHVGHKALGRWLTASTLLGADRRATESFVRGRLDQGHLAHKQSSLHRGIWIANITSTKQSK
jgi:hypothetical protein